MNVCMYGSLELNHLFSVLYSSIQMKVSFSKATSPRLPHAVSGGLVEINKMNVPRPAFNEDNYMYIFYLIRKKEIEFMREVNFINFN